MDSAKESKNVDKNPAKSQEANGTGEAASAPAVPAEILRKLTDGEARLARPKQQAASAPPLSTESAALGQIATEEVSIDPPHKTKAAASDDDGLSDPETDRAVDDIIAKESDEILAAEDAQKEGMVVRPHSFGQKLRRFFRRWWQNKWARWITIVVVLAAIGTTAAVPKWRYLALNTLGVRSSLSLAVLDNTTQLPLKNVTVEVEGQRTLTDSNGIATVRQLKLGPATLKIHRVAFAPLSKQLVIGWGSNPLGDFTITAVGTQYTINVSDYLSGQSLASAEATTNEANALSDKKGKIILTVDNKEGKDVPITLALSGYRTEQLVLPAANTLTTGVQLVPDRKEVFVSKQSGHYDLYKVDIDGKNKQLLLAGTGTENQNISLAVSPAGDEAALVSTRDNMRDQDGYLLTTLTLIDIASGRKLDLDHAEQLQLVGWVDHRLIYSSVVAGASAANPQRYRLISYDYTTNSRAQLANANQFNGVVVANDVVYYATTATDPNAKAVFAKVRPDGTNRQTIASQEIWTIFRSDYNTLFLQTSAGWYSYSIQNNQLSKSAAPANFASRLYVDAPDSQHSLWTDFRDGKGVLLSYAIPTGKDTQLQVQNGLSYPVRWLNTHVVIYRVSTAAETADYALDTLGGQARKITDVTHTYGFSQGN